MLSGGAARGIAHIGVLRALEEEGIRPGLVCGTSMGALVGALYATGYSSAQIRQLILTVHWDEIFGRGRETFEWRDTVVPQPWVTLIGQGLHVHLPSGMVDDSYLNFTLAGYFLPAEAMARGDFDRLPIPFRCVGTDAETWNPVVFRSGSVARAVRTSISIPLLFPAMPDSSTLLVDGGLASNLPVSTARDLAPDRILAIDVSSPNVELSERSSLFDVTWSIVDRIIKRSQRDTLSANDRFVWLELPGHGPSDFTAVDSLIEMGYREAKAPIHEFAQLVRAAPDSARGDSVHVILPPARPGVLWLDGRGQESERAGLAQRLFGEPPASAFEPAMLRPALTEVSRGDMFVSAWPSFTVVNDSTTIAMQVESRPKREGLFALGYDNDYHGRLNASMVLRPIRSRLPDKLTLGFTIDPLRKNAFFAFDRYSLTRGIDGLFMRGGWRQVDVRVFDDNRNVEETRVEHAEVMAGGEKNLNRSYVLRAGAGYGFASDEQGDLSGALVSLGIQSKGAFGEGVETVFLVGNESYATVIARAKYDVRMGPVVARASVHAGSSSRQTPADELQSVGGPETFAGMRRSEWLGHDRVAGELRFLHDLTTWAQVFAYGQSAMISGAVSRPNLNGEIHFAGGAGLEARVPFGPLNLDWGVDDQGDFRFDFNLGQRF